MPGIGSAAERYERLKKGRDLVRRTALLLSADVPLPELFAQLAVLLAVFVDASSVLVAIGDERESRLEYIFEDGVGGRPDDPRVGSESSMATVLRTGEPLLRRRPEDWSEAKPLALGGRETWEPASAIFVPIPFGGRVVGVLSVQSRRSDAYDEDDVAMLESCAIYLGARLHDEERRATSESLKQMAATDALTGLANRRSFDETLAREWSRCARARSSFALAMIDVDYFKKFNDAYGHVAGDACLRHVARAIAGCVKRPGEVAARYGGEEFAVILPHVDAASAVQLAESICTAVRGIAIPHEGSSLGYATVSVGVAALVPGPEGDPQSLVAAADAMLYEAKKRGRNRVAAGDYRGDAPPAEVRVILRHNLPRYLTEMIGREQDTDDVASMLHGAPLVSVVGPGGVGKTRLAVQVAQQLLDAYADGVWFVDLAPFDDPLLVPSAIAELFGVADEGGSRPLIERVGAALKEKQALIVLDNCEHLLAAAADATGHLLRACPQIQVLATSREPLGVPGERSYRMPALPVPPEGERMTAASVMQYGAAALFVSRAVAAQHTFVLTDENAGIVADVVRRLDGIALAIELAAPRIKVLSVAQLDRRLDERFKLLSGGSRASHPRQQTLLALIGWSYDLLDEPERSLLRQAAIFRGAWTLEAAEAICSDERFPDWEALDVLASLVDKSLVVVEGDGEEPRYRLLESTRQFAAERLLESGGREEVAARHCRFFAGLARRTNDDSYWLTDLDVWTAQVRREMENYRAAIAWGLAGAGDAEAAATIVASLRWLWYYTARSEGRLLLERAKAQLAEDASVRVLGHLALAEARLDSGSVQAVSAADAERLLRGLDECGRAEALTRRGSALGRAGRLAESAAVFEEALIAARAAGRPRLMGWVLSLAAYWIAADGDRVKARAYFDESASLLRACNDRWRLAHLLATRAERLFADGDVASALAGAREAEAIYRERSPSAEANLAAVLRNAAAYLLALGRLDEAWIAAREGLELALRAGDALWVAIAIGHLANLAAENGDMPRAARLLGYVDAIYRKIGNTREPTEQRGADRTLALLRSALSEDRIAELKGESATLEQDAAVAEATEIARPPASLALRGA
jgi:diguanylate cyclase (GGDEF)-like protein